MIVTQTKDGPTQWPSKSCGGCRQVESEFGNFPVYTSNTDGTVIYMDMVEDLLPGAFRFADFL